MRGKIRQSLLFCFLLISLLVSVYAYDENFQYTTYSNVNACACSNFFLEGTLVNVGNEPSSYLVTNSGTAAPWAKVAPQVFSLNADEEEKLVTFFNIPCNADGDYTFYTSIKTALGKEKVHAALIDVDQCNIIKIDALKLKNQICMGDVAVYKFNIKNIGMFDEEIVSSISEDVEKYINFTRSKYSIKSGEEEEVFLYLHSNKVEGEHEYNVEFTALKSGFKYRAVIEYNAVDCHPKPKKDIESKSKPIFSPFKVKDKDVRLFNNVFIGLLIAFVVLLFLVLVWKAVKKRKEQRVLKDWITPEEKPIEKPRVIVEKKVVEKKVEKPKKVVQKKLVPKKKKGLSDGQKRFLKNLFIIYAFIILLILIGVGLWFALKLWPSGPALSEVNETLANQTISENMSLTGNATNLSMENISSNITNLTDLNATGLNASGNESIGISQMNPIVKFFTSYGNQCALVISIFIILFLLSLLLFSMKPKRGWQKWKVKTLKYAKYILPVLFFICLVFSFLFCIYNNTCNDSLRCIEFRYENVTTIENITLNQTEELNYTDFVLEQKPAVECFCNTLFGGLPTYWCLIIIILIFLIALGIFIVYKKPIQFHFERKEHPVKKEQKLKVIEVIRKPAKVAEQKAIKKVEKEAEKKEDKEEISGVWKDILILLVLLLLLAGIAAFFYYYNPFGTSKFNAAQGNMSDNLSLDNLTQENITGELLDENATEENTTEVNITQEEELIQENLTANQSDVIPDDTMNGTVGNLTENATGNETIEEIDPRLEEVNNLIAYVEENNLTESFTYFIIGTGSTREIVLTDYFIDPDNDTLMFTYTEEGLENITIEIWRGVATITADPGFIGIVNVTFTAEDPSGESVSGNMSIIVGPEEEESKSNNAVSEIVNEYWWYIAIGFAIVVLLVIILFVYDHYSSKKEKKKDKKQDKNEGKGFFASVF